MCTSNVTLKRVIYLKKVEGVLFFIPFRCNVASFSPATLVKSLFNLWVIKTVECRCFSLCKKTICRELPEHTESNVTSDVNVKIKAERRVKPALEPQQAQREPKSIKW